VSEQTRKDIQEFYFIPSDKIRVIYQSCDEAFYTPATPEMLRQVKLKHKLPGSYLLYVGTIEERKNLLTILKAMRQVKDIPLVVIGKKRAYYKRIAEYIQQHQLGARVLFPENVTTEDLPAIYAGAEVFIYPSVFEGFGIPVIEALTCKTPVITTLGGCFAEAGGPGSVYIDPHTDDHLAAEMNRLLGSRELRKQMAEQGYVHAEKFRPETVAGEVMKLYLEK
jgi:glycosyltransferase involved in cell wall biosynthesis